MCNWNSAGRSPSICLKKLGAKIKIKDGYIVAVADKGLIGSKIKFPSISVGATENAIIAASGARGETILSNCAIEPEVLDLISFLKKLGSNIEVFGRKISIRGTKFFKRKINHKIIFDRIEAGTYLVAGTLLSKKLIIKHVDPKIIKSEINALKSMGAKIIKSKNSITILKSTKLKKLDFQQNHILDFN